jgi:hypothetical protein
MKTQTSTITEERSLIRRINRYLNKRGETLCKTRKAWVSHLGQYHVVTCNNHIGGPGWLTSIVDLKNYLRDLSGVVDV